MAKNDLYQLIDSFPQKEILLIGDTIVDHYTYGTVLGTSAETPTLVARELRQNFSLGGACLVCRYFLELKSKVHFFTLVGKDAEAALVRNFSHPKLVLHPFQDEDRKTTVKRRYWVDGYKLLQFDQLDDRAISSDVEKQILAQAESLISSVSAMILSDYRHGFLTSSLIAKLVALAKQAGKSVFVDSQISQKQSNHHLYQGASLVCLNWKEAKWIDPRLEFPPDFRVLQETLGISNIVLKLGDRGSVASLSGKTHSSAALSVKVLDTCGAGDAFLAALALSGLEHPEASLQLANIWAGLSTTVHGPQPPPFETFMETICTV